MSGVSGRRIVLSTSLSMITENHGCDLHRARGVINPRLTCAVRVTVLGLCVSVHGYSGTTGYEVAYERYQRLQNNEILKNKKKAISLKQLR